ncbi:MAG: peroxidase family protein, partial [Beijerinckiaceae bacterium]
PNLLTEPQLADTRNDVHAMLSQLTVLLQLLHNHIIDKLAPIATDGHERVQAFRHYYCARSVVEIIYRHIIEKDVLPKILDPAVLKRYSKRGPLWGERWNGVPIEFSFGAFRFAHSMPRDAYRVSEINGNGSLGDALLRSSTRAPSARPMTRNWLIDWVNFFTLDAAQAPNFSRRIGPHYAADLTQSDDFPAAGEGLTEPGLVTRDLTSASLAGLLSVPALIEKMRGVFGHELIDDFETWKPKIKAWLMKGARPLSEAQAALVADDPPLAFFVMFEAQYPASARADDIEIPLRDGGSERINGMRLGPLGSAIVAETIFGALAEASFEFETPDKTLSQRIALCAKAMYGAKHDDAALKALKPIPNIDSMPDLIRFLEKSDAF